MSIMKGLIDDPQQALEHAKQLWRQAEQSIDTSMDFDTRQAAIADKFLALMKKEEHLKSLDVLQNYQQLKQAIWEWNPDMPKSNDHKIAGFFQSALLDELNVIAKEQLLQQEDAILERFYRYQPVVNNELEEFNQLIETLREAKEQKNDLQNVQQVVELLAVVENKIAKAETVVKDLLQMTVAYQTKLIAHADEITNQYSYLYNKGQLGERTAYLGAQKINCASAKQVVGTLIEGLNKPDVSAGYKIENFKKELMKGLNQALLTSAYKDPQGTSKNFIQKAWEKIKQFYQGKKVNPAQQLMTGFKKELDKIKTVEPEEDKRHEPGAPPKNR